jgi:hypothetical protein
MTLTRLSAATFDLGRASVRTDQPVTLDVTGDGAATLRLLGRWASSVVLERDGQAVDTLSPSGGVLTVAADLSGHHVLRLVPQGRAAVLGAHAGATGSATPAELPATGGTGAAVALVLVALGLATAKGAGRLWTRRP